MCLINQYFIDTAIRDLDTIGVLIGSALTFSACKVKICTYEHFPFGFWLGFPFVVFEVGTWNFLQLCLVIFSGLLPFPFGLQYATKMLLGLLSDCLLTS